MNFDDLFVASFVMSWFCLLIQWIIVFKNNKLVFAISTFFWASFLIISIISFKFSRRCYNE